MGELRSAAATYGNSSLSRSQQLFGYNWLV